MAVHFDAKFTDLAAEILRDALRTYDSAVRTYDSSEGELQLAGFNSAFSTWDPGALRGLDVTGSFAAITESFPAITGSFPALTGAFRALGQEAAEPTATLKRVFKLPSSLPGIRLPETSDLAAMARSASTMAELEAFARWLGPEGCLVTDTDDLTGADAAEASLLLGVGLTSLSLLWEYALTSGWFELADSPEQQRTWAAIGQTAWRWADGDDQGALYAWAVVFAAVTTRALDLMADASPAAARKLHVQGQGTPLVVMLFMARRSGMTTRDAEDLVREGAIGNRPSARLKRRWDAWVRQYGDPAHHLLRELAALSAVTLPRTPDGTIELTPLGLWALREQFALDKISVPVLPPSAQMSPPDLVALSDTVSDTEFEAVFATWMRDRDPDQAARELLIYAGSCGPNGRLTAVDIARRIGLPACRAWRDAMRRPELRGYARTTLSMMAADLPESILPLVLDLDPDDMTWLATDLLAMACGASDPDPDEIATQFAAAVPAGEEARILGLMAQSSHPDVARVLDVLGTYHPDRRVAKDARKAARVLAKNRRQAGGHRVPARATRL
jgi:hypothetical protein